LKKGSPAAKKWGAKMKRLRNGKKSKTKTKRKRSTRKGGRRKTARRAYVGLKKRVSRRKKISQKRIRVRKIKEVVTQDWFFN